MKTYIAFSDVHGDSVALNKITAIAKKHNGLFFAGDGYSMVKKLEGIELYAVGGNCDIGGIPEIVTEIESVKILLCHGHRYGVKQDLYTISMRARELECGAVIFGHTHIPYCSYEYGTLFLNPGTCSIQGQKRTYAVLTLDNGTAKAELRLLDL